MFLICIILLSLSIILFIISYKNSKNTKEINTEIEKKNKEIEETNRQLETKKDNLNNEIGLLEQTLEKVFQNTKTANNEMEEMSQKAFTQYVDLLEKDYDEKEQDYDILTQNLKDAYDNFQQNIMQSIDQEQKLLNTFRETRAAAMQAQLREQEIKEQLSFYCLQPTENELDDIKVLERVKSSLHQPRILCMLIWSTYFQKPMTALCNNVLGTSIVTGIYKITNQETNQCYIGQAVDVATRWKNHAKCGLGIDTPANNKLYKAIQEYGIWNFSWELLEKCSKEELNEKESFYIDLYDSKSYGYNSSNGIKKS